MPRDVHAALTSATTAAAHIRGRLAELAHAVAENDTASIVAAARSVTRNEDCTGPLSDSPDRPAPEVEPGSQSGEPL